MLLGSLKKGNFIVNVTEPLQTSLVLDKFLNGFLNGYIFDNQYTSNLEENEANRSDFDFLVRVWKSGVTYGRYYRFTRIN